MDQLVNILLVIYEEHEAHMYPKLMFPLKTTLTSGRDMFYKLHKHTLREKSSQTNVILQYKLLASMLSAVCSVIQQS